METGNAGQCKNEGINQFGTVHERAVRKSSKQWIEKKEFYAIGLVVRLEKIPRHSAPSVKGEERCNTIPFE
jgi:hypothetical protein